MTKVTLQLSETIVERLQHEAARLNVSLDRLVGAALEQYFADTHEPSEADLMASLRVAMRQALAGDARPAHQVLDALESDDDGDNG